MACARALGVHGGHHVLAAARRARGYLPDLLGMRHNNAVFAKLPREEEEEETGSERSGSTAGVPLHALVGRVVVVVVFHVDKLVLVAQRLRAHQESHAFRLAHLASQRPGLKKEEKKEKKEWEKR